MQISWLDDMVEQGTVSPEARDEISRDCQDLVKAASAGVLDTISNMVGGYLAQKATIAVEGSLAMRGLSKQVMKSRDFVQAHPEFEQDRPKALARFDEVAKIAPSVAADHRYTFDLVKRRLHSGLTNSDKDTLAVLHASNVPMGLRESLDKKVDKRMAKAAAVRVAETYADMYCLVKEAKPTAGGVLSTLMSQIAAFGLPMAGLAVGTGATKAFLAARDKKKLEEQMGDSFSKAMKMGDPLTSPLRADPAKAKQAFRTLAHFAPHVAAEPSAAHAFMTKIVSTDMGVMSEDVKTLTDIEKNIRSAGPDSPSSAFTSGLSQGAQVAGFPSLVSGVMKAHQKSMADAAASSQ